MTESVQNVKSVQNVTGIPPGPVRHPDGSGRVLWVLPAVFVLHDGEEAIMIPRWMAAHRGLLEELASGNPLAAKVVSSLPAVPGRVAAAIGFVVVGVTVWAARSRGTGGALYAYAMVLGGFFVHGFIHLGQAVVVGGYVPGLWGALLAVIPGCLYLYRELPRAKLLTRRAAVGAAVPGVVLIVPVIACAHLLAGLLV